jgi:two-component system phosphate regulon sensor histidine kinase PhoR
MNYLLYALLLFAFLALAWLAIRHARLRRAARQLAEAIRRVNAGETEADLPELEPLVGELSSAVAALVRGFAERLSLLESDRLHLAAVLDQMTDAVLIVDADGRVGLFNPAARRLFPVEAGASVVEVLRDYQLADLWQRASRQRGIVTEEVEIGMPRRFLQVNLIPMAGGGRTLLLFQDLTRLRRLETVRRDFVSNLSHELRTPLASLKTLAETLHDGALEDPPAARRFLGRMQTEVDAMVQIVNELLELSRIESGQVPLKMRALSPAALVHSVFERMFLQAERARLGMRVECPPDLPDVKADPPRLEQALMNLVHNAVKFTPPGGEIVLSAAQEGEAVVFAVQDTGVGIPVDDLPRIFERFYKADRARSGGGTGLGLSIARHLVEAHSGRLWAESEEGRGSKFYFSIPVMKEA